VPLQGSLSYVTTAGKVSDMIELDITIADYFRDPSQCIGIHLSHLQHSAHHNNFLCLVFHLQRSQRFPQPRQVLLRNRIRPTSTTFSARSDNSHVDYPKERLWSTLVHS
jgi:hypothetical protein